MLPYVLYFAQCIPSSQSTNAAKPQYIPQLTSPELIAKYLVMTARLQTNLAALNFMQYSILEMQKINKILKKKIAYIMKKNQSLSGSMLATPKVNRKRKRSASDAQQRIFSRTRLFPDDS